LNIITHNSYFLTFYTEVWKSASVCFPEALKVEQSNTYIMGLNPYELNMH